MNKETQVLQIIADILEVDIGSITLDMMLDEERWDSLAVVTFISEVDSNFEQILSPKDVFSIKRIADLVNLVK